MNCNIIDKAKRVRDLVNIKEKLLQTTQMFVDKERNPSKEIRLQLNWRTEHGMYSGFPGAVVLEELQIEETQIVGFLASKILAKIEDIEKELVTLLKD